MDPSASRCARIRRATGSRAARSGHRPRDRKDGGGRERDADRSAGRPVETTSEEVSRAEQTHGAERREGDVEPRLRKKSPLAVEHADERRVERVDEKHASEDAERAKNVRSVLEVGCERRDREEHRGEARGERAWMTSARLWASASWPACAGDGPRHALNRRTGDHVVRNVRKGEDARESPVTLHPDDARKHRLLDDADQNEPDFGSRDGDAAAPGTSGFVSGCRGLAHRRLCRTSGPGASTDGWLTHAGTRAGTAF